MGHRVIVVSSRQGLGEFIRDTLQNAVSLPATLVPSAETARTAAQNESFDLALVDFSDPDLDAVQLIRQLQDVQPTLAFIGLPLDEARPACKDAGLELEGYLPVPFYFPNLAQVTAQALDLPMDSEDLQTGRLVSKSQADPVAAHPPSWLQRPESARTHLNHLLQETSAHVAVLSFSEGTNLSSGGLSEAQLVDLQKLIDEHLSSKGARGALARYVDLTNRSEGYLLFSTVLREDFVLSLVFDAEIPFGTARRDANKLAKKLLDADSAHDAGAAPKPVHPPLPTGPASPSPDALTTFEETVLDGLELPPPAPSPLKRAGSGAVPEPPTPTQSDTEEPGLASPTAAEHKKRATAAYTIVLVPRSTDHLLTGLLAETARQAVSAVCRTRSYSLKDISLHEHYLRLTLDLPTSRSPTSVVQELRRASSHMILARHPQISPQVPSRQFWDKHYLLQRGKSVGRNRLEALLREART